MIRLVMESIKPYIEAIPWVERYGGLIYALTLQQEGEGGDFINKTVPFSDYVTTRDCFEESDRYLYLTPDDSKKSIVYFEQLGDTTFSDLGRGGSRLRGVLQASQNFRLVCWVNLNKIGSEFESDGAILAAQLWAAVDGIKIDKLSDTLNLPVTNIKWTITSEVQKSLAIFSNYSYNDRGAFLMYPFDFFAFNVTAQFFVKKGCITAFPVSGEVCIDQSAPVVMASFAGAPLGEFDDDPLAPFP